MTAIVFIHVSSIWFAAGLLSTAAVVASDVNTTSSLPPNSTAASDSNKEDANVVIQNVNGETMKERQKRYTDFQERASASCTGLCMYVERKPYSDCFDLCNWNGRSPSPWLKLDREKAQVAREQAYVNDITALLPNADRSTYNRPTPTGGLNVRTGGRNRQRSSRPSSGGGPGNQSKLSARSSAADWT